MKTATSPTATLPRPGRKTTTPTVDCRHHWLLGQPSQGWIDARCKICGQHRLYPAVLDDLDPQVEAPTTSSPMGVATAAGGARPSSVASSPAEPPGLLAEA